MKRLVTINKRDFLKSTANMLLSNELKAKIERHKGCLKDIELIESGELDIKTLSFIDRGKIFSLLYPVSCCSKNKLMILLELTRFEVRLALEKDE